MAISKLRIACGVGVIVFVAILAVGLTASLPSRGASAWELLGVVSKSLVVAAIGGTAIVAFLAVWVAGVWIWVKTWGAFGHVPRWSYGWILNPEALSDEGKAARLWLFRVYGSIAIIGLLAYGIQKLGPQ